MITFRDAIRDKEFTILGQLCLHQDLGHADVVAQAETLRPYVDAVSVTDNPHGEPHMSGVAVAAILKDLSLDAVLQFGARDRNRVALKSDLLGAAALGVTSLILLRGKKLPDEGRSDVRQYYDTGTKFLVSLAGQLSEFQQGKGLPELFLGTKVRIFRKTNDWQPTQFTRKIDFGAQFVITQPCLDAEVMRDYMSLLVAHKLIWRCQAVITVPVVTTVEQAVSLHENTRGPTIPASVVSAFQSARDPRAYGIDLAADLIRAVKDTPGASGVHVTSPSDVDAIAQAIDQAAVVPDLPSASGGT